MDLSLFLAKVIGLYIVIVCTAALINRRLVGKLVQEFSASTALVVLAGIVHIILGLLVVISHNIWTADWRGLITLFGWLGLIKGGLRLYMPEKVVVWGVRAVQGKAYLWINAVFLLLGVYLTYVGFTA